MVNPEQLDIKCFVNGEKMECELNERKQRNWRESRAMLRVANHSRCRQGMVFCIGVWIIDVSMASHQPDLMK